MALQVSVSQSGGKVLVYASNSGARVAVIDNIVLTIQSATWSWQIRKYPEDFYTGSGRVDPAWAGLMFDMNYSSGPAKASATADYFEVDHTVTSATKTLS